ncbi:glycosyltransferase family 4 protein [Pseudofrankia asymbiotica]|uniref:glycosyltransferase family 4 protein n=1 Tax=Pseudofrankia asymbiotica TaxID=1834516 RepID=UPI001F515908|nr:glycosyltransferase family 4 protein [Pseudofrankia asymbiotica]
MRKHVLIIVQNLPVPLDRRVWLECQALVKVGYEVSVICPKGPGDPPKELLDGVWIYKYEPPAQASGFLGYLNEFIYCWFRVAFLAFRLFATRPFSAIQACNPPDTYAPLALLFRPFGVRFVYDQHDLCPEIYLARFAKPSKKIFKVLLGLERLTYRAAHQVISTNESYRAIAIRRGHRTLENTTVVRSGPDTTRMKPGPERPELRRGREHLICYLGIMGPQDGVDVVLRAMDIIVHKFGRTDVGAALLGFGDCLEELRALSTELGLDDYVTFTGRADSEMIRDYLSTAAVGVGPDPLNELNNFSTMNKIMEYMAHQLPVVTFDLVETRVSALEAAVYVEPGDLLGFATAISDVIDDPDRRRELGELGRRRAVEVLDWSAQARAYVDVYDRVHGLAKRAYPAVPEPSPAVPVRPVARHLVIEQATPGRVAAVHPPAQRDLDIPTIGAVQSAERARLADGTCGEAVMP